MAPLVRRTWALQGHTPLLYQKTRSHTKISMIAALTVPPVRRRIGLYFSLHANANITSCRLVRFLKALSRQLQKPMLVIWDRARIHRSKVIGRFLEKRRRLDIAFFPAYAPELNPVEPFWGYLKKNPLANFAATDTQSLSSRARYHSRRIGRRPGLLRSFLSSTPLFSSK
jgi:transposase